MRARTTSARRAAARGVRRLRARRGRGGTTSGLVGPTGSSGTVGMVEHVSRRVVLGWVSVPRGAAPTRVSLLADDLVLASTYATADASMSGSHSALRGGRHGGPDTGRTGQTDQAGRTGRTGDRPAGRTGRRGGRAGADDPRHEWQGTLVEGPPDDRRNSADEIRVFAFRIRGIWPFLRPRNRLTVRVDDRPLPIFRHGTYLQPRTRGKRSLAELRELFAQGHLLSQSGQVVLSRRLDTEWQQAMMALHDRVHREVRERFGHETFAVYGTLLGAVREGGPIGHDADFDTAYLSDRTGPEAAAELVEVALGLVEAGLEVECGATALHLSDPDRPGERIDLFHCYFDDDGTLAFPFGVAGTTPFTRDDWAGLTPTAFLDREILVPVGAEKLVAHLYGDDWRHPKPGFNWAIDRTAWSPEGRVSVEQQTAVHWASFYHRHRFASGSSFFEFARGLDDLPQRVVDIGCGDGRDARAFAAAGHTVLGLDASAEGVQQARRSAGEAGLEHVSFEVCDVGDAASVRRHLGSMTDGAGPVTFYLRFFLHAIPEATQELLLAEIAAAARPGDLLLAEFRTLGDAKEHKAHGQHYRRYQDAGLFRDALEERFGFAVEHFEESRGLSPYGDEDPVLCRVVARRAGG